MTTILLRTVVIYIILTLTMRLMGKRQLGELEVSELATTLLLSEIVCLPVVDQAIPIPHAVIPLITILTLEMVLSIILLKCPFLKNFVSSRPNTLIRHGKLDQKELRRIRISLDELISEIRQAGFSSIDEVDYAILESNGKVSVIGKKRAQPPTTQEMGLATKETGIVHVLIADGKINDYNLRMLSLNRDWLNETLKQHGKEQKRVFFLGRDDSGKLLWIDKEEP